MFGLSLIRRRGGGSAPSIPPGTYATPENVADAIAQLIGGAPPTTLDSLAEIASHILQNESSLAAISAALAGKQAADPKLAAFAGLALAADKLIYATGGNTLATSNITAFARTLVALAPPAANRILASDGANAISLPTGTAGRAVMAAETTAQAITATGAQPYSLVLERYVAQAVAGSGNEFPYFTASGVIGRSAITTAGREIAAVNPGLSTFMYFNDSANLTLSVITAFGRSFAAAASAQAARAILGVKASVFKRTTNLAIVANTPTELTFDTTVTPTNYNAADVALASGRVQASNATAVFFQPGLTITVDGAIDLEFTWSKQSGAGVASVEDMLLPTATRITFTAAGTRTIPVPGAFQMTAGGNDGQLKIMVQSPVGAATQNITSAKLLMRQG